MSVTTTPSARTLAVPAVRSASITATDAGLLVLRLGLAIIFFAHGAQKLLGWWGGPGLAGTVQFMTTGAGIPAPLAYLAIFTEFFGALALFAGVFTRLASLGLFVTMLVAGLKIHLANGFFMNWSAVAGQQEGYEYNLALAAMALALVLTGPGRIALGDWEAKLLRRVPK